MTKASVQRKIVKPMARGQVTIPAQFREALGIGADTLLEISLADDRLEIVPLRQGADALRRYTVDEISRFVEEDRLDAAVAKRVRDLLRRKEL